MPVFEFEFSEPFLIESFRRYRRTKTLAPYAVPLKAVLGLCLAGLMIVCVLVEIYWGAALISFFLALLVLSHRIDERQIARRFRKSPHRDDRIRFCLSAAGITITGAKSNGQANWAAFTAARRLDDGFLLFQGPEFFSWLPFKAVVEGTTEEAEELIRANVPDYKRV